MTIEEIIKLKNIRRYYSLEQLGINDYAFPKESAIEIINFLKDEFHPIFGGDVFKLDGDNISFAYAFWSCEPEEDESPNKYLNRSYEAAIKYIQERNEDKNFIFSITFKK